MLTTSAKDYRVEWAKSYLNKNWKKVMFSDEAIMKKRVEKRVNQRILQKKFIELDDFFTDYPIRMG
jgi:hypothetical protein